MKKLLIALVLGLGLIGFSADAQQAGVTTNTKTVPINISTATTTKIIGNAGSHEIAVTHYLIWSSGTTNLTWEYGTTTTTPCDTGTTALSGPIALVATSAASVGNGAAAILHAPPGNDVCILTSAGVQISGHATYNASF